METATYTTRGERTLIANSGIGWLLVTVWTPSAETFIGAGTQAVRLPVDKPIPLLLGPQTALYAGSSVNGSLVYVAIQPVDDLIRLLTQPLARLVEGLTRKV